MTSANQGTPRPLVQLTGSAAIAATLIAFVAGWEGKRNVAYQDIVGVWTICYGDTADVKAGQVETDEQCAVRLERQLAAHVRPVLQCTPGLADPARGNQLIAAASLAYNIGPRAYCGSTAARRFNAGRWREGCDAILSWNRAGGRVVRGLARRREAERAVCLKGL